LEFKLATLTFSTVRLLITAIYEILFAKISILKIWLGTVAILELGKLKKAFFLISWPKLPFLLADN
jgi:hypothetical protein